MCDSMACVLYFALIACKAPSLLIIPIGAGYLTLVIWSLAARHLALYPLTCGLKLL